MKHAFFLFTFIFTLNAQAATEISRREVVLPVEISAANVKWSRADYVMPTTKVLVPELAAETVLDHRNRGEGAPCLAAPWDRRPEDVVQNRPGTEEVNFTIVLEKEVVPNRENNSCAVFLLEKVDAEIRGVPFQHLRQKFLGDRHIDDCR